ncbi:unnamed protein product [Dicrocoelium dendriticum]|nr:unnamed protein product [Dicrocoelium dendriticum]
MQTDPYWCNVCDVTFTNEKASYEHDISLAHHQRYEESQKACGGPVQHFCSICDIGFISSLRHWEQHSSGKRHRIRLKEFHQFYSGRLGGVKRPAENPQPVQIAKKKPSKSDITLNTLVVKKAAESRSGQFNASTSGDTVSCSSVCSKTEPTSITVVSNSAAKGSSKDATADVLTSVPSMIARSCEPSPSPGGLMLNALEAVNPGSGSVIPVVVGNAKAPASSKGRISRPQRTPGGTRGRHNHIKWDGRMRKHSVCATDTSLTTYSFDGIRSSNSLLGSPSMNSSVASPVPAVQPRSTVELQSMQEALDISRQLDTLCTRQHVLQTKIRQLQDELNKVRSEKRTLKLRRMSILRGLANSESDDEPTDDRVPSNPDTLSTSITSSEKQVASVAPVAFTGRASGPTDPVITPSSSAIAVAVNALLPPPLPPPLAPVSSGIAAPHTAVSILGPKPSTMAPSRASVSVDALHVAQTLLPETSGLLPQPATDALDLQRLALIRQALQSPDCWQFTFEDVDQMLLRTAARAAAAASSSVTTASSVESETSILGKQPSSASTVEPACAPVSASVHSTTPSRILIKGEPTDTRTVEAPPKPIPSGSLSCQVSCKQTGSNHPQNPKDSSSSDSSDQEPSAPEANRVIKSIKHDPCQSIDQITDQRAPITLPLITQTSYPDDSDVNTPQSPTMKGRIKYGEFHAFDGGPAAVIDMALHNPTYSVIIGGQNGSLRQYSLKSHQPVKSFPSRDASVTCLILESQGRSLYVGYYDNCFSEYDMQSGVMAFQKTLPNRVEALTLLPSQDSPFIYLGMSNGDILRHHVPNRTTSVLYQSSKVPVCGISSMASVRSGSRLILLVGERDCSLTMRAASDGSLIQSITSSPHKGPPEGITVLPTGSNFCSYSEKALRVHNWKSGVGVLTVQTQKITSCCVMERFIAIGDSEGSIRVYRMLTNGLPATRPIKVYYASTQAAITSMISCGVALVSGGLDGTVTVIWVTEPATNYTCLYGPFGHTCGIGFGNRKDLITHVMNTHLIFGNQKSVVCRWGGGRCRTRFADTKSIKAISDHLLTHIPD